MKRRLYQKEEEILNLREKLKTAENTNVSQDQQLYVCVWQQYYIIRFHINLFNVLLNVTKQDEKLQANNEV